MGKNLPPCLDCRQPIDDEPFWCDICSGFTCLDCDPLHDCTGELEADEQEGDPNDIEDQWYELFRKHKH